MKAVPTHEAPLSWPTHLKAKHPDRPRYWLDAASPSAGPVAHADQKARPADGQNLNDFRRSEVSACGIVTPAPATRHHKGVVFITLEDETGTSTSSSGSHCAKPCAPKCCMPGYVGSTACGNAAKKANSEAGMALCNLIAHWLETISLLLGRLGTNLWDFHWLLEEQLVKMYVSLCLICTNKELCLD
jgi:hypothetical protein